ncbi:MAG: SAM-dependent methyltransferase [Candidatus Aenigmatarchaeota archaeon]
MQNKDFFSLSELQQIYNKKFYTKTKNIYSVFKTFAKSRYLQSARAKNFYDKVFSKIKSKEIFIAEIGAGFGYHTKLFLDSLLSIIKSSGNSDNLKINLHAFDISSRNLHELEKRVTNRLVKLDCIQVDLNDFDSLSKILRRNGKLNYDLITFHEMLDDLPAKVLTLESQDNNDEIFEILFSYNLKHMKKIHFSDKNFDSYRENMIPNFLLNYYIAFNFHALDTLKYFSNFLNEFGYIEITDYGFLYGDLMNLPYELWNLNIVREIENHITVDVNFSFIKQFFSKQKKFKIKIMKQKEFCELMHDKKLFYYDYDNKWLDYYSEEDLKKVSNFLKLHKKGIEYQDNYYYMTIINSQKHY